MKLAFTVLFLVLANHTAFAQNEASGKCTAFVAQSLVEPTDYATSWWGIKPDVQQRMQDAFQMIEAKGYKIVVFNDNTATQSGDTSFVIKIYTHSPGYGKDEVVKDGAEFTYYSDDSSKYLKDVEGKSVFIYPGEFAQHLSDKNKDITKQVLVTRIASAIKIEGSTSFNSKRIQFENNPSEVVLSTETSTVQFRRKFTSECLLMKGLVGLGGNSCKVVTKTTEQSDENKNLVGDLANQLADCN